MKNQIENSFITRLLKAKAYPIRYMFRRRNRAQKEIAMLFQIENTFALEIF
jgi:hypothetical protein